MKIWIRLHSLKVSFILFYSWRVSLPPVRLAVDMDIHEDLHGWISRFWSYPWISWIFILKAVLWKILESAWACIWKLALYHYDSCRCYVVDQYWFFYILSTRWRHTYIYYWVKITMACCSSSPIFICTNSIMDTCPPRAPWLIRLCLEALYSIET